MNRARIFFYTALPLMGLLVAGLPAQAQQKSQHMSPIKVTDDPENWETEYWSKIEYYKVVRSEFTDQGVLMVDADSLSFSRWYRKVPALPYSAYKLSFRIKTQNVRGEDDKSGAGIRVGNIPFSPDSVFTGSHDWKEYEVMFNTNGDDSFLIECLLGKRGRAKGKVWFDDIRLQLVSSTELKPGITIDVTDRKEPMSSYLYGQFIEHMGRSIYGGIWAEMLADRKFYYVPGDEKSPWKIIGDSLSVFVDSVDTYSENNNVAILQASKNGDAGIEQNGLDLLNEKGYKGRVVLKADKGVKSVKVTLFGENESEENILNVKERGYHTLPFEFHSGVAIENGRIRITALGKGQVRIAAVSLMPHDNIEGFRTDVLELLKQLNTPVYRWPGGNFVSGYNWKDGIGEPDKRPTRYEKAWNGLEYNDVGIHEFMKLCKLLNAEPYVAVNTGLGTVELAAEEVTYCNGDSTTPMGKWRAENGHPEPYGVKFWAVGNEMFGEWQLGHMPVEKYAKKHNEVARAMWEADPNINLIAVGYPGKWNDMMYSHCADYMNFISEHFYRQDWHAGGLMTHVKQIPNAIREIAEEHRRCREETPGIKKKDIKIVLDEWNYWYGPHVYGLLGTRYFLRDALGIAAGINEFSRQSDMYFMANYAQTINVIGAIKTTQTNSFFEGTGLVLMLFRDKFGSIPVCVSGHPEPLDIAATLTNDEDYLTISVINPTKNDQILHIDFQGTKVLNNGIAYVLTGENDMVYNDSENERIRINEYPVQIVDDQIKVPAISAVIYRLLLEK